MNLPHLPTDNLYKFLGIFGLVLIVFSSYMFNQASVEIEYKLYDSYSNEQVKEFLVKNDSISETKPNLGIVKLQTEKQKKKFPRLVHLYLLLFLLGFVLSIFGFYLWFLRTQKIQDKILKNESEKLENNKVIFVHTIQFEKEFDVYKSLWPELLKLRNATHQLRPTVEFVDPNESEQEVHKRKGIEFNNAYKDCGKIFENNKPFYPEDIFVEIEAILKIARKEAVEWRHQPKELEYFKNAEKNIDLILSKIEKVCLEIRDRIGTLQIKN
jgi:hypothetical protein